MSVARGSQNAGHYYSNIVMPQEIAVSWVVDETNGLGITSLKSNGWVRNVFMHTATTPSANDGVTNPNPAAGIAVIQLKQNFNVFLGMNYVFQAPQTGGAVTSTVAETSYIIRALGTTTAAEWLAVGLPAGLTAAVGQSFVATATQAIGGTGSVSAVGSSGIVSAEVMGVPNASISNDNIAANGGAYVMVQFLGSASTKAAPTAGCVVNLRLFFDRSSVTVDGL